MPSAEVDSVLTRIADYVLAEAVASAEANETARLCLMDSIGCALAGLSEPECRRMIGPVVPGAFLPGGARVPGTAYELEPVQAAFCIGAMIRWLDYNDTWLAAEWGHPSDNFGGILALADYHSRRELAAGRPPLLVRDVLGWAIKAYEIQGVLALENAFNRAGLDHVLLVRVATAAVAAAMLGGSRDQVLAAVSNAWLDGGALRAYRHAPQTGPRKSWAAGDATSRGVRLALWALADQPGYPRPLTAPRWGFQDALLAGREIALPQALGSYVIENVLFKVAYPAEFHGQTAVEAAIQLHPILVERGLGHVARIEIETTESAVRIIDKSGPLRHPADRDHCLQYMTAVALLKGDLAAEDYGDEAAADPRIDSLRSRMQVRENERYSRDYLDPTKRSIANAVQLFFDDGSASARIEVEYPLGHRRRRAEAIPLLFQKFQANIRGRLPHDPARLLADLVRDPARLDHTLVPDLMKLLSVGPQVSG